MVLDECIQIPVSQGQFIVDKKTKFIPILKSKMAILVSFFPPSNIISLLNNDRWAVLSNIRRMT
jgi:hypothetical protein